MKRSKNSFSIDLASSPSKIEPAANLTQIAASWDERGNKNVNEELKRKEKRRRKKKRKEFGKGGNGAALMIFRDGMPCHFQKLHSGMFGNKMNNNDFVLSPHNPLRTRESEISACYKFHTPQSVLDGKSREMSLKYIFTF